MTAAQPIVRHLPDATEFYRTAAEMVVQVAREAIAARGRFTIALAGGQTPRKLYELLAAPPYRDQIDWSHVQFFWGDERAVPPVHADSNYRMAREAVLDQLAVRPDQVHRIEAERADREAAAADYQAEIARVFQVPLDGPPPAFDLVLLGMGPDGHTASLFPQTEALKEKTRWVVANYVPKFSAYRITLTTPILNRAAHVVFLVSGEDKKNVLAEVLSGPPDPARLPSQSIRPESGQLLWLVTP